jgi:hypothetical protein
MQTYKPQPWLPLTVCVCIHVSVQVTVLLKPRGTQDASLLQTTLDSISVLMSPENCLVQEPFDQRLQLVEECPQQPDGVSCGLFAIFNTVLVSMGLHHRTSFRRSGAPSLARETVFRTLVMLASSEPVRQHCGYRGTLQDTSQELMALWRNTLAALAHPQVGICGAVVALTVCTCELCAHVLLALVNHVLSIPPAS